MKLANIRRRPLSRLPTKIQTMHVLLQIDYLEEIIVLLFKLEIFYKLTMIMKCLLSSCKFPVVELVMMSSVDKSLNANFRNTK